MAMQSNIPNVEMQGQRNEEAAISMSGLVLGLVGSEIISRGVLQDKPVYIDDTRVHHWQVGIGISAVGGLTAIFAKDRNMKRRGLFFTFLGLGIFLHDFDDFNFKFLG